MVVDFPYGFDGPHVYSGTGTYANRDADIEWTTVQYAHSIGEVVTAAAARGARVHLPRRAHCRARSTPASSTEPEDDGRYRLRLGVGAERDGGGASPPAPMPVLFTLLARKGTIER